MICQRLMRTNTSKPVLGLLLSFAVCAFVGCSGQLTSDFSVPQENGSGILGGKDVNFDSREARRSAMLVDLETNQICSATLIRPQVLLTAAHCIPSDSSLLSVFFDVNPLAGSTQKAAIEVSKTVIHPQYTRNSELASVDLALVFLKNPAPKFYRTALLPKESSLRLDQMVEVSGYGKKSITDDTSFGRLAQTKVEILGADEGFFEVDQKQGIGICDGDSGGSAFQENASGLVLVGVTKMAYDKYAQGTDTCLGVSQFTRVDRNLSWILQSL